MISRGSWRLSRKCANGKRRRLLARSLAGAAAAPNPEPRYKKPAGRSAPGRPGPGSWRGRAAREPGHLRQAGAAAAAQVRSRLSPTWRGGGGACRRRAPRAGRWMAGSPRRGARLPGGGLGAGPRSHFVLCKSHESGFPRAGAVMPAAEGRARAPLCRHRAGRRRRRLLPARPGRRSAGPRALARAGLPRSLPPRWLARSLAPRLPGPAPSSLRSLQSASRLNLALWAAWSEGSRRGRKMGASAGRKRRRRPRARGAGHPPPRSAGRRARGRGGSGERAFLAKNRSWAASAFPRPAARVCWRREPLFLFSARGQGARGRPRVAPARLGSAPRGLVISTTERSRGLGGVGRRVGPGARPEARAHRWVGADLLKTPSSPISTLLFFSHGFSRVGERGSSRDALECQRPRARPDPLFRA